ncbi:hypothetical protein ADUPG1_006871 [Aduncisulcus paluster]|uniref:RRM domain-containing protein n=2 Tax=Aduncisulcus paluster TaxID=2918883 RepID=A0ABQ5KLG3_9EUKA|nr:hypothetical protein ADUPG1_006871 [Aduncisulcus paluster]
MASNYGTLINLQRKPGAKYVFLDFSSEEEEKCALRGFHHFRLNGHLLGAEPAKRSFIASHKGFHRKERDQIAAKKREEKVSTTFPSQVPSYVGSGVPYPQYYPSPSHGYPGYPVYPEYSTSAPYYYYPPSRVPLVSPPVPSRKSFQPSKSPEQYSSYGFPLPPKPMYASGQMSHPLVSPPSFRSAISSQEHYVAQMPPQYPRSELSPIKSPKYKVGGASQSSPRLQFSNPASTEFTGSVSSSLYYSLDVPPLSTRSIDSGSSIEEATDSYHEDNDSSQFEARSYEDQIHASHHQFSGFQLQPFGDVARKSHMESSVPLQPDSLGSYPSEKPLVGPLTQYSSTVDHPFASFTSFGAGDEQLGLTKSQPNVGKVDNRC